MSEFDYDQSISMACQMAELQRQLAEIRTEHLRVMTVLTHAMGGEIRVSELDFERARGVELLVGLDPTTGDMIYHTRKPPTL